MSDLIAVTITPTSQSITSCFFIFKGKGNFISFSATCQWIGSPSSFVMNSMLMRGKVPLPDSPFVTLSLDTLAFVDSDCRREVLRAAFYSKMPRQTRAMRAGMDTPSAHVYGPFLRIAQSRGHLSVLFLSRRLECGKR